MGWNGVLTPDLQEKWKLALKQINTTQESSSAGTQDNQAEKNVHFKSQNDKLKNGNILSKNS